MTRETPSMLLLVVDGASQNEMVITHTPFTIGRLPDRDLVLSYPYISRAHAEIVYEDDKFQLVDCGSRSGCYVNGTRVEQHVLSNNDVIHVGSLDGPLLRFGTPESSRSTLRSLLQQMQHASKPDSDLEKLSWFLEAARKLNDVGAVHEILVSLIETTLQLTQVERGYVFLKDLTGHLKLSVARNVHGEPLEEDSTISHSAIKRAIESDSEFIVTDTLSAEAGSPSQSMVAQSIRTVICIPLLRKRSAEQKLSDRDLLGMLYLDSRQQRGKLTRIDSDLLKTIATEAAVLVENTSLAHAEEAARHYREELTIAADIQRGLMAVRIPEMPYARIHANSISCKEVGGDFYDVLEVENGLYVIIADISGKGISAALLASTLQGLVHSQIMAGQSLVKIATIANQYICEKSLQKYATLVLLRLTSDGALEYMNCGHVQPLLQTESEVKILPNGNLPVGLIDGATYSSETIQMKPGERVLLVTDGVTEAEDPAGEFFGDDRLQASVMAGTTIEELFRDVEKFMRGAPPNDDCTMLEICFADCK
jgi:phosphoserine phosphatase RsbU/P